MIEPGENLNRLNSDEPIASDATESSAGRWTNSAFCWKSAGNVNAGFSVVYADIDDGAHTLATADTGVISLMNSLEARLHEVALRNPECVLPQFAPTATTIASIEEAARIIPRVDPSLSAQVGPVTEDGLKYSRFRLPKPDMNISMPVGAALDRRRSVRSFGPVDIRNLSTLLFHAARVRSTWTAEDGYEASSRASPSAGARHPVDLVVVANPAQTDLLPEGYRTGAYIFDPFTCEMICLPAEETAAFRLVLQRATDALGAEPPIVIAFRGRFERTASRYRGGISLIYRDAGALMATLGIVSAAMGIGCCPLAVTAPAPRNVTPPHWLNAELIDLGGAAVGSLLPSMSAEQ